MHYFLYARKSTDTEDKQVLSIEAQLTELRGLAKREGLTIVEEFVEKQSAKKPGRAQFNKMIARIHTGEAEGIICWKLDRLARNPVDSGQVSWLLQEGILKEIKTPERSYLSEDSVLLMSVEFGMANQYVRDLAYNTKRGLRAKAARGEFPSVAPLGYRNNPKTKRIDVDRKKAPLVVKAFEMYAKNNSRYEDIANFFFEKGIKSVEQKRRWKGKGGKILHSDRIKQILTNTFYYGDFEYAGEMHHGTHTPIISKKLFDEVQKVIKLRGKERKAKNAPQPLCGLMKCGTCGCSITAETITKRQKNGNVHRYVYYRCTKKRLKCDEPYIREEALTAQLKRAVSGYALPKEWADEMFKLADQDERASGISARSAVAKAREELADIDTKLSRLTDLYIDQDIERSVYLERKKTLMSDKRTVNEKIATLEHDATAWLQPLREWITEAQSLNEIANGDTMPLQKSPLQKIFGSNLSLTAREARGVPIFPWAFIAQAKEKAAKGNQISPVVRRAGFEPA